MRLNPTPSDARNSKNRVLWLTCLAAVVLVIGSGFVGGRGAQVDNRMRLSVQDPRPLAKAIEVLQTRSGLAITYEDPLYVNGGEVTDVTPKVRKDLNRFRPGEAPKVLIPRGGAVSIDYKVIPGTDRPADPMMAVHQLVKEHSASGNAGVFRVEQSGQIIHVIPAAFRNREGVITAQQSVLDAVITLPEEERSGVQTLQAICEAISQETGTRVVIGVIPLNLFIHHRDRQGGVSRKARDMLVNLLENIKKGTNLSWRLLYDPGMGTYALNIHIVPTIK